jgi:hypothetical protein
LSRWHHRTEGQKLSSMQLRLTIWSRLVAGGDEHRPVTCRSRSACGRACARPHSSSCHFYLVAPPTTTSWRRRRFARVAPHLFSFWRPTV